jgi:hypothetical protein
MIIPPSLGGDADPAELNPEYADQFGRMGEKINRHGGVGVRRFAALIAGKVPVDLRAAFEEYLGTFFDFDLHCINVALKDKLVEHGFNVQIKAFFNAAELHQLNVLQAVKRVVEYSKEVSIEDLYDLLCDKIAENFLGIVDSDCSRAELEAFLKKEVRKLLKEAQVFKEMIGSIIEGVHGDVKGVVEEIADPEEVK